MDDEQEIPMMGRWRTSTPSTPKLDEALAKAQGEILAAARDANNPHYNRSYADLSSIIGACSAACSKHGVARYQPVWTNENGEVVITTRIAHAGEWAEADLIIPVDKRNAQGVGSAITYGKRYGLAAMLGIPTTDDDGENAAGAPPKKTSKPATARNPRASSKPATARNPRASSKPATARKPRASSEPTEAQDLGPRCSGDKGGHISEANERHMKDLAVRDGCGMGDVWTQGLKAAEVDLDKYGQWANNAQSLTIADGMKLRDVLKSQLGQVDREPGDDGDAGPPEGWTPSAQEPS